MQIKINTGNGCMDVDLAAFFPNSMAKTRKLFRLISAGCGRQDQETVRDWLILQGTTAAAVRDEETEKIADLQEHLESLEKKREELKLQCEIVRKRVREAEGILKSAEQMEKQSPVWVKEFDRICGE